jgi:hypothetical protein
MLTLEGKLIISMSQTVDSDEANININQNKQQSFGLPSASRLFDGKTRQDKDDFRPSRGLISYLSYCRSSLWLIFSLLHPKAIFEFFIRTAQSNPIALPKRAKIVSFGVPFLFIILLVNLPIFAAGQEEEGGDEEEEGGDEEEEDGADG